MADEKLGGIYVSLGLKADEFKKGWNESANLMDKKSKAMLATAAKLSIGLTAPLTLLGKEGVREFREFDKAMTKSTSIMADMTAAVRQGMEEQAIALSLKGVQSAEELAASYFTMASSGMDAGEAMKNLPIIAKFATAGFFDMNKAATMLIDSQNSLGLTTEDVGQNMAQMNRIANVLVKANQLANASTEQFAEALSSKAAASLKLANKELEEGVAILAAYAKGNIKGSRASTFLTIALRELQTKAITNKKEFDNLGISVFDSAGEMLHMSDILKQFEERMDGASTETKRAMLLQLGFTRRSVDSITKLVGFSDRIRDWEHQLKNAGDTMDEVSNKRMKGFDEQMTKLGNKFSYIEREIGGVLAPALEDLNEIMDRAITLWKSLDDETKENIVTIGAAAAALGPLLGAAGTLGLVIPALGKGIAMLALLGGKLLLVGASIGAIIATFDYFTNNEMSTKFKIMAAEWIGAHDVMKAHTEFWMDDMKELFDFGPFFGGIADDFAKVITSMGQEVKSLSFEIKNSMGMTSDAQEEAFARKNLAFAKKRMQDVGLSPSRYGGQDLNKVIEDVRSKKLGFTTKQTAEAIGVLRDYNIALNAELEKNKKAYDDHYKKQDEAGGSQAEKTRKRKAAILKIHENTTKEIDKLALTLSAEKDVTFFQHVENRLKQFKQALNVFEDDNKKVWDDIDAISTRTFDKIVESSDKSTKKMTADFKMFGKELKDIIDNMESGFTSAWENMFNGMMDGTLDLKDAFQQLGMEIMKVVLQQALIKPAAEAAGKATTDWMKVGLSIGSAFVGGGAGAMGGAGASTAGINSYGGVGSTAYGPATFADGGAFGAGGVLTSPTPFGMSGGGMGIAGEAGPEAALPLKRGSDGKLGVSAEGMAPKIVNQTFNIQTENADTFKRSERQIKRRMRNA